ncbi:MIP/aquaporin family protein [Listeria ilorinensis]|uniref:MIP/aquaporin family protein n=1 Tax=Listeria ilorinensis TaxID=2867439 RepID=UPI001EF48B16|nr:aquaporin [Listeria ilorinensis]
MKRYLAEFLGTFVLVFLGTGTVVIAKGDPLSIGLAFGFAVTIMAYSVGGVSGGHFNPGVSIAMVINKRLEWKECVFYIIFQAVGSIVASATLFIFIHALNLPNHQFGQTDFSGIRAIEAFACELLITFLFVFVILMVTSRKYGNAFAAPVAIGLSLAFLIIVALNLTGGSLNAARSLGPALFAGGSSLAHYWVYLTAPTIGAIFAAYVAKFMGSED